jgi:hypothetical protein
MGTHLLLSRKIVEKIVAGQEYTEIAIYPMRKGKSSSNIGKDSIAIIVVNRLTMRQIAGIEYPKNARRKTQDTSSEHGGEKVKKAGNK